MQTLYDSGSKKLSNGSEAFGQRMFEHAEIWTSVFVVVRATWKSVRKGNQGSVDTKKSILFDLLFT